jgi:cardiolipin synthase
VVFNLPNGLTLLRLFLTPVIVVLLLQGEFFWALVVFTLAGITDGLDGFFARSLKERTPLGAALDPLADKLLLSSSVLTLAFLERLPFWLVAIVVGRDLVLILGAGLLLVTTGRPGYSPSIIGKLTTALQVLTVLGVMAVEEGNPYLPPLFWGTGAVTILSGLDYLYRGTLALFSRPRNPSPV